MKNQKGITLIALIITIIVMLILVGVSVSISLNGGLFKTAKQASEGTEEKRDEELALSDGKVNVNGKLYNSMDEYVNGEKWTQNETTITKGDTTLEIGQKVTGYDAGVEGWDGEWAVLGVEDGKLLLVSTKSVAYDSNSGFGAVTLELNWADTTSFNNSLDYWCSQFYTSKAFYVRPLLDTDIARLLGESSLDDYFFDETREIIDKTMFNLTEHLPSAINEILTPVDSSYTCLKLTTNEIPSYYLKQESYYIRCFPALGTVDSGLLLRQVFVMINGSIRLSSAPFDCRAVVVLNPEVIVTPK